MHAEADVGNGDALASALSRVADVATEEARVQAQVAAAARSALQERGPHRGNRVRDVLDLLAGSTERLVGGAAELRRAWAAQLAARGLSRREIAARLGVTRQRVSVLLGNPEAGDARRMTGSSTGV